ncbi:MAG: polysaccharide pyruvyl transferase family protein [Clostridium sp.]|nr:polysaccharide pyruvyl transferase family protein [Clostridium sp.]
MGNVTECTNCTGCGACLCVCPVDAISMKESESGFLYPEIDEQKCTDCGLCKARCPILSYDSLIKSECRLCYAASASDEIRKNSSSGGVFSVLAEQIIKQHGYVCAAAFDENFILEHKITNDLNELGKFRGSKYLQSKAYVTYIQIEKLLKDKKKVLFVGTPCQVAGLKAFLKTDYETLFSVDIICHGVPSNKIFLKYLQEEISDVSNLKSFNFRDKKDCWNSELILSYELKNKDEKNYIKAKKSSYMCAFLQNLSLRKSCNSCPFTNTHRVSDITIGDFWGYKKDKRLKNDSKGLSVILLNSEKGTAFLSEVQANFNYIQKSNTKIAINGNIPLRMPFAAHKNSVQFFNNLDKMSLIENVKNCIDDRSDCAVINFWWSLNYGAALTAYALQEVINDLGKTCKIIDYKLPWVINLYKNSISENFAQKYLNLTGPCITDEDFAELNRKTEIFITGSDQVFRYKYIKYFFDKYLLGFANIDKKKIAAAGSFGIDCFECENEQDLDKIKQYFSSLDYVSVREKSGVSICRQLFNKNAEWILDPVFLIDRNKYEQMAAASKMNFNEKIVSYVLDENIEINKAYKYLQKKYDKDIVNIAKSGFSVEDWLCSIKNCDFFITDSYHGMCFALIFNKPFVCIVNKSRGKERFFSLLSYLNLENKAVDSVDELYDNDELFADIDYEHKINNQISEFKDMSVNWLKKALYSPKEVTKDDLIMKMNELNNEIITLKSEIDLMHKSNFLNKIFSVKKHRSGNTTHKVVCFLGIKIKFKSKR